MSRFGKEMWTNLKYIKKEMLAAGGIYILGILLGVLLFRNTGVEMEPQSLGIGEVLLNNIKIAFILLALGLVTVGIGSSILMFFNGATLGGSVMGVVNQYSMEPIITAVLPHVLFEIIGLVCFTAISFETLKLLLNVITKREMKMVYIRKDLSILGMGFVFLLVAAVIEGTISRV